MTLIFVHKIVFTLILITLSSEREKKSRQRKREKKKRRENEKTPLEAFYCGKTVTGSVVAVLVAGLDTKVEHGGRTAYGCCHVRSGSLWGSSADSAGHTGSEHLLLGDILRVKGGRLLRDLAGHGRSGVGECLTACCTYRGLFSNGSEATFSPLCLFSCIQ